MVFSSDRPAASGRYRWRAGAGGRIHMVTVKVQAKGMELKCSTMDARTLLAQGEWSLVRAEEGRGDQLDAILEG